MRIVHICLSGFIDGWGYQENLLPIYQARDGHDVSVIAPKDYFPDYVSEPLREEIRSKGSHYEYEGVHIHRIPTRAQSNSLTLFSPGLYRTVKDLKPDIIFHHDVMVPSLLKMGFYKLRHHKVVLFVDNHADEYNQTKKRWWFILYYRWFTRLGLKLITPYVTRYYGVTPARCDYLDKVFGVPASKIDMLPIGGDEELVDSLSADKELLREEYSLPAHGQIIISGGKMGVDKGTPQLIRAFSCLRDSHPQLCLVLFGVFTDDETVKIAENTDGVIIFGWCDRRSTLELLMASDVACWPKLHTTLVEDAVACSVPVILRKNGNTVHSVMGNGEFVLNGDENEIAHSVELILYSGHYDVYKEKAEEIRAQYSYCNLARKVIADSGLLNI